LVIGDVVSPIRENQRALTRCAFGFSAEFRGFFLDVMLTRKHLIKKAHAKRDEQRMPKDTLAREQEIVVQAARCALTRTIEQYSPIGTDTLPITTVAISRMFADLINNVSSAADIVDVINRQIEQTGYRLIETRRH
jgi:hypothetical protein